MNADNHSDKKSLLIPILLIVLGSGWMLNVMDVLPGVNWAWSLGLGAVGILAFVLSGFDKFTIVVGPLFLSASMMSVMRQTGRLSLDMEVPFLVIFLGLLLLVARTSGVPNPRWIVDSVRVPKAKTD